MTSIFSYENYKTFFNDWVAVQPRKGHGQLRKLALYLKANSVVMSQVFRGDRELTLEHALGTTKFIGLTEVERDYFLLMVQRERAGTHQLRSLITEQMGKLREQADTLKTRLQHEEFDENAKLTFYSHWYYSAVRLGASIPENDSIAKIADYLKLDRGLVASVCEFLIDNGLVVVKNENLELGPSVTHIAHDSPLVTRHHANWRLQGLQNMTTPDERDLFYSGPMVLSAESAEHIRNGIVKLIEEATNLASESKSEVLRCLNIDWFNVSHFHN